MRKIFSTLAVDMKNQLQTRATQNGVKPVVLLDPSPSIPTRVLSQRSAISEFGEASWYSDMPTDTLIGDIEEVEYRHFIADGVLAPAELTKAQALWPDPMPTTGTAKAESIP